MQEKQGSYREIFERVYTDNYLRLYYYALHVVNDEEAAKDILNDVAVAFQGLDQNQKLFVTQQLVGIDQSARMVEVFDNLSKSTDITAVAMGSAGSAAGEVAARLESAQTSVDRFGVAFTNLATVVGDSFKEAAKEAINGGTDIEMALQNLVQSGAFDPLLNMVAEFAEDTGTYRSLLEPAYVWQPHE